MNHSHGKDFSFFVIITIFDVSVYPYFWCFSLSFYIDVVEPDYELNLNEQSTYEIVFNILRQYAIHFGCVQFHFWDICDENSLSGLLAKALGMQRLPEKRNKYQMAQRRLVKKMRKNPIFMRRFVLLEIEVGNNKNGEDF